MGTSSRIGAEFDSKYGKGVKLQSLVETIATVLETRGGSMQTFRECRGDEKLVTPNVGIVSVAVIFLLSVRENSVQWASGRTIRSLCAELACAS